YKFRLEDGSLFLIRFSGTEQFLRIYCQSSTLYRVQEILAWAKSWATYI
ncbi:MAG: phosphoglucomutase/phosphomannomutase family protein, partial [Microcystis sp.]